MRYAQIIFFFIALTLITSCDDDKNRNNLICDKLQSRDEAIDLRNRISDSKLDSTIDILDNLIGDWSLIGVIPGWKVFVPGEQCISLYITDNNIELTDHNTNEISNISYELKSFEYDEVTYYYLDTDEDPFAKQVGMNYFSKDHMSGAGRVLDADEYFYEKI